MMNQTRATGAVSSSSSLSSGASSSFSGEDTPPPQSPPPVTSVVVAIPPGIPQEEIAPPSAHDEADDGDQFVLSIVADRADQARRDIQRHQQGGGPGYPNNNNISNNTAPAVYSGEELRLAPAEKGAPLCQQEHSETHDLCQRMKEKASYHDDNGKTLSSQQQQHNKCIGYHGGESSEAVVGCYTKLDSLEIKALKGGGAAAADLVLETTNVVERSISRPGAVHVNNPLGGGGDDGSSSELYNSIRRAAAALEEEADNNNNNNNMMTANNRQDDDDEENCLRGISAHVVNDDDDNDSTTSGEARTTAEDMACSERLRDQATTETPRQQQQQQRLPPVAALVDVTAVDTPDKRFLYFSVAGIVFLILVILLLVLGLAGIIFHQSSGDGGEDTDVIMIDGPPPSSPQSTSLSKLEQIRQAGVLRCAYNIFAPNPFEETLCKVLAAAIMGRGEGEEDDGSAQVEFINLPLMEQRFEGLANGEVDVLIRVITHTMERDVYEGNTGSAFAFSTPYMYEGMKIAGDPFFVKQCAEKNLKHIDECSQLKICVAGNSTHYDALATQVPERYLVALDWMFTSRQFVLNQLKEGRCNTVAADSAELSPAKFREFGYDGNYSITDRYFTKDPLSMVTSSEDPEFSAFVNAVLEALLVAEEHNITQDKASSFPSTAAAAAGGTASSSSSNLFGETYQHMFQDAVAVSGHFGEIWDRYIEKYLPRDSLNSINDGTTGLIFSHPFGLINKHGRQDKPLGPHMQQILDRGILRCGLLQTGRPGFANVQQEEDDDDGTGIVSGIDADYCCAVAAALFQGDKTKVEFVDLTSAATDDDDDDGLVLLMDGSIDLVAGVSHNLVNGVKYALTQPYFYHEGSHDNHYDSDDHQDNHALATSQNDKDWSSFVYWIVSASFYAEENNITSALAHPMPEVLVFGQPFHRMFRDSVLAVGSYSEIYQRNLEHLIPRSGRNLLNQNPDLGPQHYPLPGFFSK